MLLIIINPTLFKNALSIDNQFISAMGFTLNIGNSTRFIRAMILPIAILLLSFIYSKCKKLNISEKKQKYLFLILTSAVSGLSFIWSNDYGISVWLCLAILYFFLIVKENKNIGKSILYTLLEIILSFFFIFIYITILTKGNFLNWLTETFGTGGYQSWYYNSEKSFYLFDINLSFYNSLQILISLYYYYLLLKNRNENNNLRYAIPAFANMTAFCAVNEYKLLSGGTIFECSSYILFLTIYFEFINVIVKQIKNKNIGKSLLAILLILEFSWGLNALQNEFKFLVSNKSGIYIDELGGNNRDYGIDLLNTKDFLKNKKVFSTYASALEVITNQYQPTKYDYIIHVLGDNARNNYLKSFNEGNFDYVATIQRYFSAWEMGWLPKANWFFYRELYENYHPVYGNTYELLWEKNENDDNNIINKNTYNIDVKVEKINEQESIITVTTNEMVNGYADVYLDYKIEKNNRLSSNLIFNKMLYIEDITNNESINNEVYNFNYLRDESKEYIPIKIINGIGSIKITSNPYEGTNLILNEVKCERIFDVLFKYVQVKNITTIDNFPTIIIDNNLTTNVSIKKVKSIKLNNINIPVKNIIVSDNIYLLLDTKMTNNELNNNLKLKNNILLVK